MTYRRMVLATALGAAIAIVAAGCGDAKKSSSGVSEAVRAVRPGVGVTRPALVPEVAG